MLHTVSIFHNSEKSKSLASTADVLLRTNPHLKNNHQWSFLSQHQINLSVEGQTKYPSLWQKDPLMCD